jgi:RNA recognition motif-containing protein
MSSMTSLKTPSPKRESQAIFKSVESPLDEYAQGIQLPKHKWTSLMIKNIPCRYTTSDMLDEIVVLGFHIDFLYMPPARRSAGNLGYAFVNFVSAEQAAAFSKLYQGYSFSLQRGSSKRAEIIYAKLQGFEANVDFYTKVKTSKKKNQPFINHDAHQAYRLKSCGAH